MPSPLGKVKEEVDAIYDRGFVPDRPSEILAHSINFNPLEVFERRVVRGLLGLVAKTLPENKLNELKERPTANAPFEIAEMNGYRLLPTIGEGSTNSVYILENKEGGNNMVLAIIREKFSSLSDAQAYAKREKDDYERVKAVFDDISEIIPTESYIVFEHADGTPLVASVRELVPGKIRDIFSMDKNELLNIIQNNTQFREQFGMFVRDVFINLDFVKNNQLDFTGKCNLAVVGEEGNERLVMLDPHTAHKRTEQYRERIEARVNYLASVYADSEKPVGNSAVTESIQTIH